MTKRMFYPALILFPLLIVAMGIVGLKRAPYCGLRCTMTGDGWTIDTINGFSDTAALHAAQGRRISAINGHSVSRYDLADDIDMITTNIAVGRFWNFQRYLDSTTVRQGAVVVEYIDADSLPKTVTVPTRSFPVAVIVQRYGPLFVLGLICLVIGLAVILKRNSDIQAQVFFAMLLTASMIFFTFGCWTTRSISLDNTLFRFLWYINGLYAFPFFPVLFFHFCLIFPKKRVLSPWHLAIVYGAPFLVQAVYLPRIWYPALNCLYLAGLGGGIGVMVFNYITLKVPQYRAQVKWVLWGTIISASSMLAAYTMPLLFNALGNYNYFLPSLLFTFIPVSIAFAITRYRLFDIDSLFDNTFIYAITLAVLVGLDMAVSAGFAWAGVAFIGLPEAMAQVATVWLVVMTYVPVRTRIHWAVKKILRRELYDSNEESLRMSSHLLGLTELPAIVDHVVDRIRATLHPASIRFVMFDAADMPACAAYGPENMLDTEAVGNLKTVHAPHHTDLLHFSVTVRGALFCGIVLPITCAGATAGVLLIGDKLSGNYYSTQDRRLLSVFTGHFSLALDTWLSRTRRYEQERKSRAEYERLSREMHDNIGASFTSAIMTAGLLAEENRREECRPRLNDLETTLRSGLADLRHVIDTIENENVTVEDCAAYLRETAGKLAAGNNLTVEFTQVIGNPHQELSIAVRVALIRILQESITNSMKYARAGRIVIGVVSNQAELCMTVTDNGAGFDPDGVPRGRGLRNMERRCQEIHAALTIDTAPKKGTAVRVRVPFTRHS
jgi:signal transduction histidine kinase